MMPPIIQIRPLESLDATACDQVVASLPYHFGDVQGREQCARDVRSHEGLVASIDGELAGFLTWKPWFETALEITWMAVHAERRGSGIGTRLIAQLESAARTMQRPLLLVTTLAPTVEEPGVTDGYARTRSFYERCGFAPTWQPEGWWNQQNQALLMVRSL